jgi:SAM-dependent methyltransferase
MQGDPVDPVDPDEYSDEWLASAFGAAGNRELLTAGPLRPRPRAQRALDLCRLQPGLRLLDIACGRGEVPAYVCQHGGIGVGLDYAAASIEFARRVREIHDQDGRLQLIRGDATALPFPDDSFDRVTMLDIIEHLHPPELEAMFREVRRVLRPDGFAVIHTLPNRWLLDITYPLIHRLLPRIPRDPRGPYEKKIHVNEQDLPRLHGLLGRVGLGHRLWLEQWIPAQARWNRGQDQYRDQRDRIYPLLVGVLGRVLEWISLTPVKLLICNDIFGILWKDGPPPRATGPLPRAWTERLAAGQLPTHVPRPVAADEVGRDSPADKTDKVGDRLRP